MDHIGPAHAEQPLVCGKDDCASAGQRTLESQAAAERKDT
jgi:hypothetical protein